MRHVVSWVACAVWLAGGSAAQAAVQVEIHFPVLERALSEQMFTPEGRRYVRGSKTSRCTFAYLSMPKLGGWQGKLTVKARFTGRSAVDVLGKCIGLGDDFQLTILATPVYKGGKLGLKSVNVITEGKESMYIRGVRNALAQSLEREFSYPLEPDARRILQDPRPGAAYKQEVSAFNVPAIEVTEHAVVLTLDFRLAVK